VHLAIALEEFGEHPAAGLLAGDRPVFHPGFHVGLIERAERALIDFVTLDEWPGRLDTGMLAVCAAERTSHIGLVLTGFTAGDPADVAARIATLDQFSGGRAGWRPRVAGTPEDQARPMGTPEWHRRAVELFGQAGDFAVAAKEYWRKWAVAQPVVAALAHSTVPLGFASGHADVVFVTPADTEQLVQMSAEAQSPRVFADLVVFLGETTEIAVRRKERLDELTTHQSDAAVFVGTPTDLADWLADWHHVDGFRLRPGFLPDDLDLIVDHLVPLLQERGLFRTSYPAATLRGLLHLP
jgi:alkanesulfonate monooxygenase SsuD/methylene tetrahydromethanopterin reductase-like flavin-dependent oxidoreductase (luciferase family)